MEDRLNMAVEQIRKMIDFYDLRKGIKTDENAWPMRMKGYYQLLLALLRLEHEMDPDFAWYEKRVSFENGYGASIICKPMSNGGDAKRFEIGVFKFGKLCYDTPVSYDLEGYLDFEDVIEVLHEIRELPPAEKDEPKQDYSSWSERWKKTEKRIEEDKKNGREERRDGRYKKYETEIAKKNADNGSLVDARLKKIEAQKALWAMRYNEIQAALKQRKQQLEAEVAKKKKNKKKEKKKKQKNLFADPDFFGQYKSSQGCPPNQASHRQPFPAWPIQRWPFCTVYWRGRVLARPSPAAPWRCRVLARPSSAWPWRCCVLS